MFKGPQIRETRTDFRPFSTVFRQIGAQNYFLSGFLFNFKLNVVDFIENDGHIDIVSWRYFEIRGAKVPFLAVFAVFRQNGA